jgi:hypothetical protein
LTRRDRCQPRAATRLVRADIRRSRDVRYLEKVESGLSRAPRCRVWVAAIFVVAGCDRPRVVPGEPAPVPPPAPDASRELGSDADVPPAETRVPLRAADAIESRAQSDAAPDAEVVGKARGAACSRSLRTPGDCARGLACCPTSFHGHCGGAHTPELEAEPCVFVSTCIPPPCHPMDLPP